MRTDKIDAINTQKDPNSCYRPDDEQLYMITEWDGTELSRQTKADVIGYVRDELTTVLFKINKAQMEDDDEEAFEVAKEYLGHFSALQEEE
ncbi:MULTISPECIES: hypothetical protein [Lactobacillaceae]|uniref:Uncharacterized protein n=2 Tax=Ligilactobacillus TaxID=2767887 RepID=A0AAD0P7F0_9LACO|nr:MULTISPECIES: hypothetical protein [Lactobacillaceae]AWZ37714.1 hypothetical protein CPS94_01670 [Ligilactobacillus murinus]AWZ41292.1 hypothetical protein CPQ89_09785 [Ligilactobacillus murinus]MBX9013164.1 hypothetical protein [Ligilactobacillus murinus]HCM78143.1 hypothetical protein [Lactobacillus sp.]